VLTRMQKELSQLSDLFEEVGPLPASGPPCVEPSGAASNNSY
jgi:hypothetical protein